MIYRHVVDGPGRRIDLNSVQVRRVDMAAFRAFYRDPIRAGPLKNVSSHFAMERVKATTA